MTFQLNAKFESMLVLGKIWNHLSVVNTLLRLTHASTLRMLRSKQGFVNQNLVSSAKC